MTAPFTLTSEQKALLARACAFIDTEPSPDELGKLFTLVALQLPEPLVALLRRRAAARRAGEDILARWLH